jgi:hypothetical protein
MLSVFARQRAGSTATVDEHTRGRITKEACSHHIVSLGAPYVSLRYI